MHSTSNTVPTVLVVDDEPLLRLNAVDVLEEAGCSVLEAGNAAEALTVLASGVSVDIVFTDVPMPGALDGIGLSHALRNRWPGTAVVVTSGAVRPTARDLPDDVRFLAKPYPPRALKDAVFRLAA